MSLDQKENSAAQNTQSRKYRARRNQKRAEEGNDYILKRYRLEENKHFKDRANEQLNYEVVKGEVKAIQNCQEDEDQLVIVPLEVPSPEIEDEELTQNQGERTEPMVYMFDDEEEQERQERENKGQEVYQVEEFQKEIYIDSEILQQNQVKTDKNDTIRIPTSASKYDQLPLKKIQRSHFSTAELLTPASVRSKNNIYSINKFNASDRAFMDKKTVKYAQKQQENNGLEKVQGVELARGEDEEDTTITIIDKKLFAMSRLPSGIILRCIIKRTNSFLNMLSPQYDLYLANGLKHILSVKKYPMRNRQLFKFSTDPVKFSQAPLLSIMHANQNHNIYWLLQTPQKIGSIDLSLIQLVIGYYRMKNNEKHRRFSVLVPNINTDYQLAVQYDQNYINFGNFKEEIKVQLNNLQFWSDMNGNSTKNFVVADEGDEEYRYLQMKKQSQNVFELTIQHPLSPLQAMAVAMTRFDAQLT